MDLKCVIIDDEQYAIDALVGYINEIPNLIVHQTFTKPVEAISAISEADLIDFIFLDIEMPEISGLELAKNLREKTRFLVFTTGHAGHAITAFDLKANQYLLKPITLSKFALTISEILKDAPLNTPQPINKEKQLRFIKADHKNAFHFINPDEITYVEAAKNYVIIYTVNENEKFMTHMGLNHIEAALDRNDFIRINKSTIIAKRAIKKIEGHTIKLKTDKSFQLGEVYKPAFQLFLNENMLRA